MHKTYAKLPLCLALSSLVWLSLACGGEQKAGTLAQGATQARQPKRNPDLPVFEKSAAELQQTFDKVIAEANKKLAKLVAEDVTDLGFENTFKALEELQDAVTQASLRAYLLKDVSPIPEVMSKAAALNDQYNAWFSELYNNGALYKVLKAYAKTTPKLAADKQKLVADTIWGFERNGINETGAVDPKVLTLQKEISDLQSQIERMIIAFNSTKNYFTAAELEGLTPDQLASLTKEGDSYVVLSGARGTLRDVIMGYATKETTRKRAKTISNSRAQDDLPLITTLVKKRTELAKILGYNTWADYKAAPWMAKTGKIASDFVDVAAAKLRPKFERELAAASKYLTVGVNDDNGQIDSWDLYFFKRLYETNELKVDYGALTKYFPYQNVIDGMLRVYEQVLGLKIEYVKDPEIWHPDVTLVKVSNRFGDDDDKVVGYVYFDNFPRLTQGKMSHFASDAVVTGRKLPSGKYRKPVNALTCNFPVDATGTPEPMLLADIEMLFHEFGHALHCILGEQRFASQYSFNTPQDFVEVPSTLSEYFVLDPNVLKQLAAPHPDLTDAFVKQMVAAILNAKTATKGMYYERQFGLDKSDFVLHTFADPSLVPEATAPNNLAVLANQALASAYLPYPDGSSFLTSYQHILTWGYDGGVYSYAWSDSIAAELAGMFEASPKGFMDSTLGMRYRKEVFAPAASRDVNVSVEAFLGRPLDPERKAFLKRMGL